MLLSIVGILCTMSLTSQTLYTYNNVESGVPGSVATGLTASNLTRVNGALSIAACGSGFNSDHMSLATGAFSTTYAAIELTLTPNAGTSMTVTSLTFDLRRQNNGPKRRRYAYSLDGGTTWIDNGSDLNVPTNNCNEGVTFGWDFADFTTTTAVKFRIYGWDANNVNGQNQERNGIINGTVCTTSTFYADADGDGFGDAGSTTSACTVPAGYVSNNTDCDDSQSTVYPGATEICDGLDNDCDLSIDEDLVTAIISPADSAITCKGFPVAFSIESCVGCTYQWFKNDNIIVGATADNYSTTKPAYYSVQLTIPGGCFDVSDHSLLISGFNPNANIYAPNGLNICAPTPGNNIIIKVGFLATNTYQWYQNGLPYLGVGGDSWRIFPSSTGDYYCSITSEDGCNRITETLTVTNVCRSGAEIASAFLEIYPNPATNTFTVSLNSSNLSENALMQIINILGEVVYSENISSANGELNQTITLNNVNAGMYFVKILSNNQEYTSQLIIE